MTRLDQWMRHKKILKVYATYATGSPYDSYRDTGFFMKSKGRSNSPESVTEASGHRNRQGIHIYTMRHYRRELLARRVDFAFFARRVLFERRDLLAPPPRELTANAAESAASFAFVNPK